VVGTVAVVQVHHLTGSSGVVGTIAVVQVHHVTLQARRHMDSGYVTDIVLFVCKENLNKISKPDVFYIINILAQSAFKICLETTPPITLSHSQKTPFYECNINMSS
jgi:hypothetical protein